GEELLDHLFAGDAKWLGGGVEIEAVSALVLDVGEERRLAPEARRPGDPVALGQHADDLAVRVLRDLADEGAPVGIGHPVVGLDLLLGVDARVKARELRLGLGLAFARAILRVKQALGVHARQYITEKRPCGRFSVTYDRRPPLSRL